jgi:hypothetical protein
MQIFCNHNLQVRQKKPFEFNVTILDYEHLFPKWGCSIFLFWNPTTKRVKIQLSWVFFNMNCLIVQLFKWLKTVWNNRFCLLVAYKVNDFCEMGSCPSIKVLCMCLVEVCLGKHPPRKSISWNWDLLMIHFDKFSYC